MHPILPQAAEVPGWLHLRWGERSLTARLGPLPEVALRAWFAEALRACTRREISVLPLATGWSLRLQPGGPGGLWMRVEAPAGCTSPAPGVSVSWWHTWRAWVDLAPPPAPSPYPLPEPPARAEHQPRDASGPNPWLRFEPHAQGTRVLWGDHSLVVEAPSAEVLATWLALCVPFLDGGGGPWSGLAPVTCVAEGRPARWRTRHTAEGWALSLIDAEGEPVGLPFVGERDDWRRLMRACGVLQLGSHCTRFAVRRLLDNRVPRLQLRQEHRPPPFPTERSISTSAPSPTPARPAPPIAAVTASARALIRLNWRLRWARAPRTATQVMRWGHCVVFGAHDSVRRVDAQTGKTLWKRRGVRLTPLPELVSRRRDRVARLDRHRGTLAWTAEDTHWSTLDRSGPWLWSFSAGSRRCFDLRNGAQVDLQTNVTEGLPVGRRLWTFGAGMIEGHRPDRPLDRRRWAAPGPPLGGFWSVQGRLVYRVGLGPEATLVGCSVRSGQIWQVPFDGPDPRVGCTARTPTLGPLLMLLGAADGLLHLTAVDPQTGAVRWRQTAEEAAADDGAFFYSRHLIDWPLVQRTIGYTLAADASSVLVKGPVGEVLAFDLATGAPLWRDEQPSGLLLRPKNVPPVRWRSVWLVSRDDVQALRPHDGHFVGQLDLDGLVPDHLSLLPDGGVLVAEAGEARVYDLAGHLAVLPGGA